MSKKIDSIKKFVVVPLLCTLMLAGCSSIGSSSSKTAKSASSANSEISEKTADEFVDNYMQKMKNHAPAEEIISDVYTKEVINKLKECGQWEMTKASIESTYPYIKDVSSKRIGTLTEDQMLGAEIIFKALTGESVKITAGYSYESTTYLEKDGQSSSIPGNLCALYLKNDGWKVLNSSPEELDDAYLES